MSGGIAVWTFYKLHCLTFSLGGLSSLPHSVSVGELCIAGFCTCLSPKPSECISGAACTALANDAPAAGDGVRGSKGIMFVDREHIWLPYSRALQRSNSVLIYSPSGSWL